MVKILNGKVEVTGTAVELLTDVSLLVHSMIKKTEISEDEIRHAVELGLKDEKTVIQETKDLIVKVMEDFIKELKKEDKKDE